MTKNVLIDDADLEELEVADTRHGTPTYPADKYSDADAGLRAVSELMDKFLSGRTTVDPYIAYWMTNGFACTFEELPQAVWALRITTGGGKTREAIRKFAEWLRDHPSAHIVYCVERHKLGEDIVKLFAAQGITAKLFRGRKADDPQRYDPSKPEGAQDKMCQRLEAVDLALKNGMNVMKACCKDGTDECPLRRSCAYMEQMEETPQVWVVASDMLFHQQEVFGKPAFIVVDEAFWSQGIRRWKHPVAVGSLITELPPDFATPVGQRDALRNTLGTALMQQDVMGWVERRHLDAALSEEECSVAIRLEWDIHRELIKQVKQTPSASDAQLKRLGDNELLATAGRIRRIIHIWEAVRELLQSPTVVVCGRLRLLLNDEGQRAVLWSGVAPISKQFRRAPMLLLDAVLPHEEILKVYVPQVEVVANISIAMPPSVYTRQVRGAPTSSSKLIKSEPKAREKHRQAVWRYIMKEWFEIGCARTLVVCQKEFDKWLKGRVPANIHVRHFNDIAGEDEFKRVRLLILLGRIAVPRMEVEGDAGALSGRASRITREPTGHDWFPQITRYIRMRDGNGIAVDKCDQHDDPFTEHIRWQTHEGGQMQAIGRGRGIRRTAAYPLNQALLTNTVLPITDDADTAWKEPSLLYHTAATDGVMLTSPVDMMRLWPELWPNTQAADRTLAEGVPSIRGFERFEYQLTKPRASKWRVAFINRPDPVGWLERCLGPGVRNR